MTNKLAFYKKVRVELEYDPRILDYDDESVIGQSIAYILGGRDHWKRIVFSLCDLTLDADTAKNYIEVLTNALEDSLFFEKMYTK